MKEYCDFYFRKAKAENYPARSVYKLKEIDSRYRILHKGMKILDLGAAPGSWSIEAAQKAGGTGLVVACDIKDIQTALPANVVVMREDILKPSDQFIMELGGYAPFDLVMSDMAPSTTGNKFTDHTRSMELARAALDFSIRFLRRKGNFVAKIFMGADVKEYMENARTRFNTVKNFKPKSSRPESKEIFIVCQGYLPKGENSAGQ